MTLSLNVISCIYSHHSHYSISYPERGTNGIFCLREHYHYSGAIADLLCPHRSDRVEHTQINLHAHMSFYTLIYRTLYLSPKINKDQIISSHIQFVTLLTDGPYLTWGKSISTSLLLSPQTYYEYLPKFLFDMIWQEKVSLQTKYSLTSWITPCRFS